MININKNKMYCSDRNSGRTRVNKFFSNSNKRNNRNNSKNICKLKTSFQKVFELQNELFLEGYTLDDYQEEVQEKIGTKKKYYVGLTNEDVEKLHELFGKKVKREEERFNLIDDKHNLKKRQSKLFTEKKQRLVYEKRTELIENLLKELNHCNSVGVSRSTGTLSSDPEKWSETKKFLFFGGRYLEGSDKDWCKIYDLLNSQDHLLFNCKSKKEFHQFIKNN
jgi:hypothetical protein